MGVVDVIELVGGLLQGPRRDRLARCGFVRMRHAVFPSGRERLDPRDYAAPGWGVRALSTRTRVGFLRVYVGGMATVALRVRLLGGEHTDLTYEDPDQDDEGKVVDEIIEVLRADTGVLRCRHGERLVALYARGVASIEVSPRGAVL